MTRDLKIGGYCRVFGEISWWLLCHLNTHNSYGLGLFTSIRPESL